MTVCRAGSSRSSESLATAVSGPHASADRADVTVRVRTRSRMDPAVVLSGIPAPLTDPLARACMC